MSVLLWVENGNLMISRNGGTPAVLLAAETAPAREISSDYRAAAVATLVEITRQRATPAELARWVETGQIVDSEADFFEHLTRIAGAIAGAARQSAGRPPMFVAASRIEAGEPVRVVTTPPAKPMQDPEQCNCDQVQVLTAANRASGRVIDGVKAALWDIRGVNVGSSNRVDKDVREELQSCQKQIQRARDATAKAERELDALARSPELAVAEDFARRLREGNWSAIEIAQQMEAHVKSRRAKALVAFTTA